MYGTRYIISFSRSLQIERLQLSKSWYKSVSEMNFEIKKQLYSKTDTFARYINTGLSFIWDMNDKTLQTTILVNNIRQQAKTMKCMYQ